MLLYVLSMLAKWHRYLTGILETYDTRYDRYCSNGKRLPRHKAEKISLVSGNWPAENFFVIHPPA